MSDTAPRADLYRAQPHGVEFRAADDSDGIGTLTGHFSVFDQWYEVDSMVEGHFMERVAPGAWADTIATDISRMRVTFNHGRDPQLGDKVLGPIARLEEDAVGARYEVPLFDTTYNRDLLPGLKAGVYGSSMRFNVEDETWDKKPARSEHNPAGIPERTVTRGRVGEFGPVTFPANAGATAGVRSITDQYRPAPVPEPVAPAPARKENPVTDSVKPSDPIDEYRDVGEQRTAIAARQQRLVDLDTEAQGTSLAPAAQLEWDTLTSEIARLQAKVEDQDRRRAVLDAMSRNLKHQQDIGAYVPPAAPAWGAAPNFIPSVELKSVEQIRAESRNDEQFGSTLRDHAMRRIERMEHGKANLAGVADLIDNKDSADHEIKRRIIGTDNPAYERAFKKYIRTGNQNTFTAEERNAALAVGVDGTGGYAVPVVFDPTIIATGAYTSINPYRAACRTVTISGSDTWQALTANAITATYALEAAVPDQQGPTFTRPEYIVKRVHAFLTMSYEMAQDRPGLSGELTTLFAEARDTLEENQFSIGTGATVYPQGIGLKDAITRVDSAGAAIAVADIRSLEAGVPIRHRMNAAWFLSKAAIRAIQAFETTGGQLFNAPNYAATPNPNTNRTGNTGLTLLGYPVWETPSMPWTPSTTDTTWGVLMDPRNYIIVDRVGMDVHVIPDMLNGATPSFPTGEIGLYAFWRNTARVVNVDGGRQGAVQ